MKRYIKSTIAPYTTLYDWLETHNGMSPDFEIVVLDMHIDKFDATREEDLDHDLMFIGTFSELCNGFNSCQCNYFINRDFNTHSAYYKTLHNYEVIKETVKNDNYWCKGTYILLEVFGIN